MKKSLLIVVCILNSLPVFLAAQVGDEKARLNSFVENIQVFNRLYHQEKVFLHFDNTGYFLGESIWFKAYVTAASELVATPMSRVLYVELLDMEGNMVHTQKLRIVEGQADGFIPLTKMAMKSGFYEVRAYTRLMLNWDTDHLFSRVFPVFETPLVEGEYGKKEIRLRPASYNIPRKRPDPTTHSRKLQVDFYPEGGQLVHGITTTVAFKVTDKGGQAVAANGWICDAAGDTLSLFSTLHEGMGSFIYTPDGDKNKIWIQPDGETKGTVYAMPKVEPAGCVLQVQALHPQQLRVAVSATPEFASIPLGLTVMCRGKLAFFQIIESVPEAGALVVIPKSSLQAGVNQITLFTAEGNIQAERLVYVHGASSLLQIGVHPNKEQYDEFEEVRMEVSVQDAAGIPVETTLSLAVRDARTEIPSAYEETLPINMLLSSDLKGYISNPGYYFESEDRTHLRALDLLMLTQGYRRYSWTQMADVAAFNPVHKIEKGLLIDGSVKSTLRKKVRENIDVKMYLFGDSVYQQADCRTDEEGNFNYLADDFYGNCRLQLNTRKEDKKKEYWITLDRLFSPNPRPYTFFDTHIPSMKASRDKRKFLVEPERLSAEEVELLNDSTDSDLGAEDGKMLKEIVVKGRRARNAFVSRGVNLVYNVMEEEDKLEDNAAAYNEMILEFLSRVNPYFSYDPGPNQSFTATYKGRKVYFHIDVGTGTKNTLFDESSFDLSVNDRMVDDGRAGETDLGGEVDTGVDTDGLELQDYRDAAKVDIYNSSDVKSIAIIEDPVAYRTLLPKLAFVEDVKKGKMIVLIVIRLDPHRQKAPYGTRLTTLQGFSRSRAFYNPDYKEYDLPKHEDFRRTLYWDPNVKTDLQGKAQVRFFTSGTSGELRISAETITPEGVAGSYWKP